MDGKKGDKDKYIPPMTFRRQNNLKNDCMEDKLSVSLKKVEGSDKLYKKMKEDVSALNNTVTSHCMSIKQSETQIGQISSHFY